MNQKIPFTSYDFWAYLSSGFLLLFAVDSASGTNVLMSNSWTIAQGVVAISVAYVIGHVIASLSSWIIERGFVGNVLGYPKNVLFNKPKAPKWIQKLLGAYFQPLPNETQLAALAKCKKVGINSPGEAMFWLAFAYARQTQSVMGRLDNFINMYGFCRNIALVSFIDAAILYWSYIQPQGPSEHLLWARIALIIGIGMLLRYLKFYRLYTSEVITAYAYENQ